MRVGVNIFLTDHSIQPVRIGEELEARGYESLWVAEHSHIPTSRLTPWGGTKNAPPLPEEYWRTHDTFVALAAVAATTDRLKIGTGITLVAQRDPIWLAKQVASLDVISGGRLEFGIGYGWNREEMANHGVDHTIRYQLVAGEDRVDEGFVDPGSGFVLRGTGAPGGELGLAQAGAGSPSAHHHGQWQRTQGFHGHRRVL